MEGRFSCAREALARGEALHGTASVVRRWVLLEQDGPWGRDAVLESRLDPAVGMALKERAQALSARLLLIRRHGRREPGPWRAYAGVTAQRGSWVEELALDEPSALLDVDLSGLSDGASVGGRALEGPLFLVCTNGRHDACCAEYGRPLARTLAASHPVRTWESSHTGGDRFAGNLVCLPEGIYYGRLGSLQGAGVAAAHAGGRLVLDHYRGRSCHPFVVQAADFLLRQRLGLDGIDALLATGLRAGAVGGASVVTFETADGTRHTVEIGVRPSGAPRPLTCQAAGPAQPPRYELLSHDSEPQDAPSP